MRQCKGAVNKYVNGIWGREEFELGYFHQWGVNYETLPNGIGNYMVAIVELPDGRVVMPVADEITFLPKDDLSNDSHSEGEDLEHEGYNDEDMCPYDPDDENVNQCPSYVMGLCGGDRNCPMS